MGCTPSHRVGFQLEPYQSMPSSVPYPSFNTWTGSEVTGTPVALLRESNTCHISEDPPPYTEVVQDGHISLMHGCSPNKNTRDGSCSPHRLSLAANELEISTDSALLPFTTQGATFVHTSNTESSQLSHPLAAEHETSLQPPDYSEYSTSNPLEMESSFLQEYDHSNLLTHQGGHLHDVTTSSAIFPPRSIARSRSFDTTNSLLNAGHALNRQDSCPSSMFPPPLAQLPSSMRAGTLPPPLTPFPPRPGTIPPLSSHNPLLPQHPHQPLPLAASTAIHLQNRPVRPPPRRSQTLPPSTFRSSSSDFSSLSLQENPPPLPPRLPPIQSQQLQSDVQTQEGSGRKQHRKRHKRKRGQTWHGERTPLVNVEQSVVVVE